MSDNDQVYAVTKERDTLRREQNKKSDAAALLKEKDEIINQIMAEGELKYLLYTISYIWFCGVCTLFLRPF